MSAERVLLQHRFGLSRQRREPLAHVGDTRRQADPCVSRNRDHAVRPRISRQRLGVIPAADPHPMPARQFDLDVVHCGGHRHRRLHLRDDLHRQKSRDIGRVGISKPGITQPGKDQIGVHVIPPGDLAHRHTGHTRPPADHPLLFVRPK